MKLLLREYLSSGDISEAYRCLQELDVPHFHHELVYEVCPHVLSVCVCTSVYKVCVGVCIYVHLCACICVQVTNCSAVGTSTHQ